MGNCAQGPNIRINGELYQNQHPGGIIELVNHFLEARNDI